MEHHADAAQCTKAVALRKGVWLCSDPSTARPNLINPMVDTPWCKVLGGVGGCWTVNSSTHARAGFLTNNVRYGDGGKTYGAVTIDVEWLATGPTIAVISAHITNSAKTVTTTLDNSIYNGTTNKIGSKKNSCKQLTAGTRAAGTLIAFARCNMYDSDSFDHHALEEFQWTVPATFPAIRYFMKIRSIVAHGDSHKAIYLFGSHSDLPGDPWGAGYYGPAES